MSVSVTPSALAERAIDLVTIEPARTRRRRGLPRPVRRAIGPVAVLLLWYLLSATGVLPADVLASPVDVLGKGWSMITDGELPAAIAVSGERVLYGLVIGA